MSIDKKMAAYDEEQRMMDTDWNCKVLLQKDNSFIEHVLMESYCDNEEDRLIAMLDGEERETERDEELRQLSERAKDVMKGLNDSEMVVLQAYVTTAGYEKMGALLGCSTSTAWKRWQKVRARITLLVEEYNVSS